jgi:hypothetical protein
MSIAMSARLSSLPSLAAACALVVAFSFSPIVATSAAQTNDGRKVAQGSPSADAQTPVAEPDPVAMTVGLVIIALATLALVGTPSLLVFVAFALGRWTARGEARAMIAAARCAVPYQPAPTVAYVPQAVAPVASLPNDTARLRPVPSEYLPARDQTARFTSAAR